MNDRLTLNDVLPPPDEAFTFIPEKDTAPWKDAYERGSDAIRKGRAAVLILNGGMATRFSGVVKGVDVDVMGRSFLDWKLRQVRSVGPATAVYIMNSLFTSERTLRHLDELEDTGKDIYCFNQSVYPRETPDGKQFLDDDGKPSMAGRGHGDMLESFSVSGMLRQFMQSGCETLLVSNVDNLGAMLDPVLLGLHLRGGRPATIEVARRKPSHKGGIIASVKGNVQVFEGFRWPEGLDLDGYRYFNTNTFYLDRSVIASPPELNLHSVVKEVRGRKVLQKEKILGEITEFLDAQFLVVPDAGADSRFVPVKTPQKLESSLEVIRLVLGRWSLL